MIKSHLKPGEKTYYKSGKISEAFEIDADGHISYLSIN